MKQFKSLSLFVTAFLDFLKLFDCFSSHFLRLTSGFFFGTHPPLDPVFIDVFPYISDLNVFFYWQRFSGVTKSWHALPQGDASQLTLLNSPRTDMIRCGPSSDTIIIPSTELRPREMSLFIAAACYARGKHKHGNLLLLFVCGFFF